MRAPGAPARRPGRTPRAKIADRCDALRVGGPQSRAGLPALPPRIRKRMPKRIAQPGHIGQVDQQRGPAWPTIRRPSASIVIFGRARSLHLTGAFLPGMDKTLSMSNLPRP